MFVKYKVILNLRVDKSKLKVCNMTLQRCLAYEVSKLPPAGHTIQNTKCRQFVFFP